MKLFHLTTAKFALDDMRRGRLKVSLFHDLNDPFELLCAKLPNKELRRAFKQIKDKLHSRIGVICFSTDWSSSVMWSHYGDKHRGVCLGFDVPDEFAIRINYVKTRDAAAVEAQASRTRPTPEFAHKLMTTKHESWAYEGERRLYVGLEECDPQSGLYFYDFGPNLKLKEVILGPRCETTLAEARRTAHQHSPETVVYKARLAFNSYSVVPNLNTLRRSVKPPNKSLTRTLDK